MLRNSLLLLIALVWMPLLPLYGQSSEPIQAEVISLDRLNVREKPCLNADRCPILGQLAYRTIVEVLGRSYEDDIRYMWVYVSEPQTGLSGWVAASYLRFTQEIDVSATLPTMADSDTAAFLYFYPDALSPLVTAPIQVQVRQPSDLISDPFGYPKTMLQGLSVGEVVTVLGRPNFLDNDQPDLWLLVRTNDGVLGWVLENDVILPDGIAYWSLPVAEIPTSQRLWVGETFEPIPAQGQVIAYLYTRYGLQLRREPTEAAELLTSLGGEIYFVVYGQYDNPTDPWNWLYVKVIETGEIGWVVDHVYFPYQFDETTLPVLEPISQPSLLSDRPMKANLSGGITHDALLLMTASWQAPRQDYWLTEGQTVTVIGRNISATMFKIQVEDRVGWVRLRHIQVEGDALGLTIFPY